ncbi:hypothetical protein F5Y06DRAFT_307862 [Hypoxylon sp. FL0890]|nr:hypothetical protein F5Y06DRAFT_307862 [Hypoxylon sp. FL0890]
MCQPHCGDYSCMNHPEECVAWSVEGVLMACWLALQKDVGSVKYSPERKEYELKKESLDGQLREFLKDHEAMLEHDTPVPCSITPQLL